MDGPTSEAEVINSAQLRPHEMRRCWICQQDDLVDPQQDDEWKSPCPCSLTAHDTCLLEWVSNEEAPRPGEIARDHKIKCPQCRAQIVIERPRDYFVTGFEVIQRMSNAMIIPGAVASVLLCTYAGLLAYGLNTIKVVFGNMEVIALLQAHAPQSQIMWSPARISSYILKSFYPIVPAIPLLDTWKVLVGTPLIAPSLVILRTKWADKAFSFMLPLYFMNPSNQKITWPPSPGLVFATLPYLKTAYSHLYRYTFHPLELKWDMAVQRRPRAGETEEQVALEVEREFTEGFLEIRIALAEGEDTGNLGPEERVPPIPERATNTRFQNMIHANNHIQNHHDVADRRLPTQRVDANLLEGDLAHVPILEERIESGQMRNERIMYRDMQNLNHQMDTEDPENRAIRNAAMGEWPGAGRNQANNNDRLNNYNAYNQEHTDEEVVLHDQQWTVVHHIPAIQFVSSVVGALIFPPIAAIMGDILKYILPSSLVTPEIAYYFGKKVTKKGILTERWGRTVVGGCLFVLLKDAFTLYCKWKKARDYGKRIIINYKGKRKISK